MYQIDRIFNTYESKIGEIQKINEALEQLCRETKTNERIKISKEYGINDSLSFKLLLQYDGNNMKCSIVYKDLINRYINFNSFYSFEAQNINTKDKLIIIFEKMASDVVMNSAHTVK